MTGIRLVATDIDGTVLRTDLTLSERTLRVLDAVRASGRRLVFATGRPPRWMDEIADAAGDSGLAILSNGAIRYDLASKEIVGRRFIPAAVLHEVTARLRAGVPGVCFAAEYGDVFAREGAYRHSYDIGTAAPVVTLAELTSKPAAKLLVRQPDVDSDVLLHRAAALVGDLVVFTHSTAGGYALLETSMRGVTKASTLAQVAAEWGIDASEVIAFGDMPNDVEMLRWAGRSVAMGNAHPSAVSAASELTVTNDEDGVAVVLERLLATD